MTWCAVLHVKMTIPHQHILGVNQAATLIVHVHQEMAVS